MTNAAVGLDGRAFLAGLEKVLATNDRSRARNLCALHRAGVTPSSPSCSVADARRILYLLRRKRLFIEMEQLGEAWLTAGMRDPAVRCDYVQALIDQGKLRPAEIELNLLLDDREDDAKRAAAEGRRAPPPPDKVLGLLGRVYKQKFVGHVDRAQAQAALQKSLDYYEEARKYDPREGWYAINVVALVARAARDGMQLTDAPDATALAEDILEPLERRDRGNLDRFDLATGAEAALALGRFDDAFDWLRDYLLRNDADAFEVASTHRQLVEIWQLDDDEEPGQSLLPLLRHAIGMRSGGVIEVGAAMVRAGQAASTQITFERAFGRDAGQPLSWYRAMLTAVQGVARIARRHQGAIAFGTGFLVPARQLLHPDRRRDLDENELVLLTNAHVVSEHHPGSLRPADAVVTFEVLDPSPGPTEVDRVLWESAQLDAALVSLKNPIKLPLAYRLASPPPPTWDASTHRRIFAVGHGNGGPLTISLQDSLQVGWIEPHLHYRTPTEGGNSGSPLFNDQWDVIGLHHAARIGIERPGSGEIYDANEGIWIQAIRTMASTIP